jgi:hypothetical protein
MDVKVFEKILTQRGKADHATVVLGDPDFKVAQDDIPEPAACLGVRVQVGEIGHLRLRGEKHVRYSLRIGGRCGPDSHRTLLPDL